MRLCSLYLAFALAASAASFTASVTGNWSTAATWGGAGVPGNGDTATISDGVTVTVSDARVIGNSPAAGNVVLNFSNTGAGVIASGGTLDLRGDGQYTANGCANTGAYLTVQAGGTFRFDAHLASSPTSQHYTIHADASNGCRPFVTTGTSGSHATVTSVTGGGTGSFSLGGFTRGGAFVLTYTDLSNLGGASTPAFEMSTDGTAIGAWDATHSTFNNCGMAPSTTGALTSTGTFRHSFNVHTGSLGASVFTRPDTFSAFLAIATGGTREIAGNVFDIIADSNLDPTDFTIHSNYFAGDSQGINFTHFNTQKWAYFQNNFYAVRSGSSSFLQLSGDARDNLFLLDEHTSSNPHGPLYSANGAQAQSGNIVDHAGYLASSISSWVITNVQLAAALYSASNNILLPNAKNGQTFWLSAVIHCATLCGNSGETFAFEHNTVTLGVGPALYTEHPTTDTPPAGLIASFRDNILWNPGSVQTDTYKLESGQDPSPGSNICLAANCDYNAGFHLQTGGSDFTNGGNGYADNFTSTPGQHDLTADPGFVDTTRNTATFDSAYLGNHPAAWSSGGSYSVGDMVSSSDSTVYGGATINYRWTNGTYHGVSCAGNTKPGMYTDQARACWEWASLYRIRQAVAAQTLYDDQAIGAHGVDVITTLVQWIRTGFSPTNQALALAGHDGQDLGAVPVSFAAPSYLTFGPSTFKGGILRGGTLK